MSITIEGLPEYLTHEQYLSIFTAVGIDPKSVVELRMSADGVHALVFALDKDGRRRVDAQGGGFYKHRIFIPVRREPDDRRRTRIRDVAPAAPTPPATESAADAYRRSERYAHLAMTAGISGVLGMPVLIPGAINPDL